MLIRGVLTVRQQLSPSVLPGALPNSLRGNFSVYPNHPPFFKLAGEVSPFILTPQASGRPRHHIVRAVVSSVLQTGGRGPPEPV